MIKIGNDQLIKRSISFRNKMSETNCSVEDIMKIYIGTMIMRKVKALRPG